MARLLRLLAAIFLVGLGTTAEPGVPRGNWSSRQFSGHRPASYQNDKYVTTQSEIRMELGRSRAGRTLLRALERSDAAGASVGLDLLVGVLEAVVGDLTGLMADGADPMLLEAAKVLRKLPLRLSREPTAAVMVIIDEWASALAAGGPVGDRSSRLVERLRRSKIPRRTTEIRTWLLSNYPILAERSDRALSTVIGCYGNQ